MPFSLSNITLRNLQKGNVIGFFLSAKSNSDRVNRLVLTFLSYNNNFFFCYHKRLVFVELILYSKINILNSEQYRIQNFIRDTSDRFVPEKKNLEVKDIPRS